MALSLPAGKHSYTVVAVNFRRKLAPCWFVVHLRVEKTETIVLKEGRNESDVNAKA
jgi:hypothetical protein